MFHERIEILKINAEKMRAEMEALMRDLRADKPLYEQPNLNFALTTWKVAAVGRIDEFWRRLEVVAKKQKTDG